MPRDPVLVIVPALVGHVRRTPLARNTSSFGERALSTRTRCITMLIIRRLRIRSIVPEFFSIIVTIIASEA